MKLRIHESGKDPYEVEVSSDEVTIGRSSYCDVAISNPYVSKEHVRLVRGLVAIDLGSSNGTYCQTDRLEKPTIVVDGRLSIGRDDVSIEILDAEPQGAPDPKSRELRARNAGLEHEVEKLTNENEFLRLQVEQLQQGSSGDLSAELAEVERLQRTYSELLEKLQIEIGDLLEDERTA